jgi:ATP-dependent DNA helicase RecG
LLQQSLQYLRGIGPKKAALLKDEANLETIEDLIYYSPRRYLDRSAFKSIINCLENDITTISGTIINIAITGTKKKRLEVEVSDGTGSIIGIFFGGISYFSRIFRIDDNVIFSGKISFFKNRQIIHPDFDFIDNESNTTLLNTGRIIPLYPSTEKLKSVGLDSRGFRRLIYDAFNQYSKYVQEPFNVSIINKYSLISLKDAIWGIHFPDSIEHAEKSRKRLAFNECFYIQYYLNISKKIYHENSRKSISEADLSLHEMILSSLPFQLTDDQKSAVCDIKNDILSPRPMSRLLQGDVGSGKTIVAALATAICIGTNRQTAIMSPTEILAAQHYHTFLKLFQNHSSIALLTSSIGKKEKEKITNDIFSGKINVIVGTHAIIQTNVLFKNLGLIIIDEQHRFGVKHRATLKEKGETADMLVMSATPIPRSLSLTLYGELDISIIKSMPADRIPINTLVMSESKIHSVYNSIRKYCNQGRQVYYVLPLIEESEKIDFKSAVSVFNNLKEKIFKDLTVELLHGRISSDAKKYIMRRFINGEINILVTTTVIEVGLDVPNATIMIIEHPERFGLAQLHQLRGRVGRGSMQSFCVLIASDDLKEESIQRIKVFQNTNDGFKIAEEDLKNRGSGEILGLKQHGHKGNFNFIDFARDLDLIINAREEAVLEISKIENLNEVFQKIESGGNKNIIKRIIKTNLAKIS